MSFSLTPSVKKLDDVVRRATFVPVELTKNFNKTLKFVPPMPNPVSPTPSFMSFKDEGDDDGWMFYNPEVDTKPKVVRSSTGLFHVPTEEVKRSSKVIHPYPNVVHKKTRRVINDDTYSNRTSDNLVKPIISERNVYKISEKITSSGYKTSETFKLYTKDLTEKWHNRATYDINKLDPEIVVETLKNLISNHYDATVGTHKSNVTKIVLAIAEGWVFPSIPAINYVSHYGPMLKGKYDLGGLSTQTIKILCLRTNLTTIDTFKTGEIGMLTKFIPLFHIDLMKNMPLHRLFKIAKYYNFTYTLDDTFTRNGLNIISQKPARSIFIRSMNKRCKPVKGLPNLTTFLVDMSDSYEKYEIPVYTKLLTRVKSGRGRNVNLKFDHKKWYLNGEYKKINIPDRLYDFNGPEPTVYNIIDAIDKSTDIKREMKETLYDLSIADISILVKKYGFEGFIGTVDDFFQILLLCYNSENTMYDIQLLCDISQESFQNAIPYNDLLKYGIDPRILSDRVKTLWLFGTSTTCPIFYITDNHRYLKLGTLSPYILNFLDDDFYEDTECNTSLRNCASYNPSILENLVVLSHYTNVSPFIKNTNFMVFPQKYLHKPDGDDLNLNGWFQINAHQYIDVANRASKPTFPTNAKDMSVEELKHIINLFTDRELMDYANMDEMSYTDRETFINEFVSTLKGLDEGWSLSRDLRHTVNALYNTTTLEERDYENPDDPIISYGTPMAYRSYNLSDLDGSFSVIREEGDDDEDEEEKDNNITFFNPTYTSPLVEDNAFNGDAKIDNLKILPESVVGKLKDFLATLHNANNSPTLTSTIDSLTLKIENGLEATASTREYYTRRTDEYNRFNTEDKKTIREFYYQMFTLAMYTRFWSGPGHDFPYYFAERGLDNEYAMGKVPDVDSYVTQVQRDLNYTRESIALNAIFNQNPNLPSTIDDINPIDRRVYRYISDTLNIKYDWISKSSQITNHKFMEVFAESTKAAMCVLDLSDRGLKTAYIYITKIFGFTNGEFNIGLKYHLPNEEGEIKDFIPRKMVGTGHIDPQHRADV